MKTKQTILSTLLIATAIGTTSFSQEKKEKQETKIIIKSNVNGKVTTKEMSFDKELSQDEMQKIMDENQHDSTKSTSKKITVIVDAEDDGNLRMKKRSFDGDEENFDFPEDRNRRGRINRGEIERRGKVILDEIPHRVQRADDFLIEYFNDENDNSISSIRNIEAFANNPSSEFLNVKFRCTKKDLITLTLIDITGKKVAQETINDFSGNYFGQMKIDKNLKGTYFLLISQNEDGEVQRVFLK